MPFFSALLFTSATWLWLLACLILGAAYALLLYFNKNGLPRKQLVLFILRTLVVSAIAFLLFAPLVKINSKRLEKPLIILAEDNSASVIAAKTADFSLNNYKKSVKELIGSLQKNYEVKTFDFGSHVTDTIHFTFNEQATKIAAVFQKINKEYSGRNIGAVILASDGIYNTGENPQYEAAKLKSPVYTIALGDTIPKRDLLVSQVKYNDIVYLGNQFQIEVSVDGFFLAGSESRLTVSNHSKVVASKPVNIHSDNFHLDVPLILNADKKGVQQYTIQLAPVNGELSKANNSKTFFVNVIDGRTKILIVANSPHPDITAIKQSIETNKNYEVKVSLADEVKPADIAKADLLIFHQLPSVSKPASDLIRLSSQKSRWFILGAQSNTSLFSSSQDVLNIADAGAVQETFAALNHDFYAFALSDSAKNTIQNFPPLLSPFGEYSLKKPASVLFNRKIGNVITSNPLLVFADNGPAKTAVLSGEGIWRWRLEDFQNTGNHKAIDELLTKTIQYLSSEDDKRKFRVYPAKKDFDENEPVVFTAELYNDSYQLINDPEVRIVLKNNHQKAYSFIFSRTENSYTLNAGLLPSGEYSFNASTSLGKEKFTADGKFIISRQDVELSNTRANHQLLYGIAKNSGGKMLFPRQISQLPQLLKGNELVKTVAYEDHKYEDLINLKILFALILALLGLEWFIRKRNGSV